MPQPNDLSRSLVALDQNSTIIAVVELSQSSWLVDWNSATTAAT
jgi:transposase